MKANIFKPMIILLAIIAILSFWGCGKSDGKNGERSLKQLLVTVPNDISPVANAGEDQRILLGEPVILDGSASYDEDGQIVSYRWELLDGTYLCEGVTCTIGIPLPLGDHEVVLIVTDDKGATGVDTLNIGIVSTAAEECCDACEVSCPESKPKPTPTPDPTPPDPTPDPPNLKIDIEKHTNGKDADEAKDAVYIISGDTVTWEYIVTNGSQEKLIEIKVTDDKEGDITCPKEFLDVGESMTCITRGVANDTEYANNATVTAKGEETGGKATDSDPSHYREVDSASGN